MLSGSISLFGITFPFLVRARNILLIAATMLAPSAMAQQPRQPGHVIKVTLASGKELTVAVSSSRVHLEFSDYSLDSNLDLIATVTPAPAGGWQIAFNNNETPTAQQVSGEITYEGDFGQARLPWSSVKSMTTVSNNSSRRTAFDDNNPGPHAQLRFRGGATRIGTINGSLRANFLGMKADVYPSKLVHLQFDWEKNAVRVSAPDEPDVDLLVAEPQNSQARASTDLGEISFNWRHLIGSQPPATGTASPARDCTIHLSDGRSYRIERISHPGSSLKLDGWPVQEIFWKETAELRPPKKGAVAGSITFRDGKVASIAAETFGLDWFVGWLDVPFSAQNFSEIACVKGKSAPPAASAMPQRIRFVSGEEMAASINTLNGFPDTTAPGVLHLVMLPIPPGAWLAEANALQMTRENGRLVVKGLGQTYPVSTGGPSETAAMTTAYARYSIPLNEIVSTEPVDTKTVPAEYLSIAVTLRTGAVYRFPCTRVQFVRYPDRIWNGTMYNPDLGAWYWRQMDSLAVGNEDGVTNVQLDRVKHLSVSGHYPRWDVEVEGNKGGPILKGQIVPEPVAAQSPGVSTWNEDREGFWFWSPGGRAFLFVPINKISELAVASGR
jgi:hypothetical protein